MNQLGFFALREDVMALLKDFEVAGPLRYVLTGILSSPHYILFNEGAAIPNLGAASSASAINCCSFLVSDAGVEMNLRPLTASGGMVRFAMDQLNNPDTIVFSPGGLWNHEILLHGRAATTSQSKASQALMRRFQSALRKRFTRLKAFYVGPQAIAFLREGKRLTISVQSPREFDLTML